MRFFTNDLHYFHENIITFCNRKYGNVDAMNWDIVRTINAHCTSDDTLYILGDYAFKVNQEKDAIIRLSEATKPKRILIEGNHDYKKSSANFGFAEMSDEAFVDIKGVVFRLVHYPLADARTKYDVINRPESYVHPKINPETKKIYPILCGHVHDEFKLRKHCLNVGWDIWKRPISENEIFQIYEDTNAFTENLNG